MSRVLHRAEEHGQSRPLTAGEVLAFTLLASVKALALGIAAAALVVGGRLVMGEDVTGASILLTLGGVGAVALAFNLVGDLGALTEGLRQWRFVETFSPSPPSESQPEPHSPILVRTPGGSYLDHPDEPLALPSPERKRLQLTPETVSVILKEIVEGHGGQWSRARIMAIKVEGRRVPRRIYEQLTTTLTKAGLLAERAQGGYEFPSHIKTFDDLAEFFPGLPGTAGRTAGGQEWGTDQADSPASGGVRTLAERHAARWEANRLLAERLAREEVADDRPI